MSRSTKRNFDGTRSVRQLGSASCPNGRKRCGVCTNSVKVRRRKLLRLAAFLIAEAQA